MMRCAVVEISSGLVTNLIIADPAVDPAPDGSLLIGLPDDSPVSIGWIWDGENFIDPNPEPVV
jgi:hypothetical protein